MRVVLAMIAAAALLMAGCKREQRIFDPGAAGSKVADAGGGHGGAAPGPQSPAIYEQSAYAVGEGKRLYEAYNCVACHQHGGGGIGPALMDAQWIYGSHPDEIFTSIAQGRPNGMPSFGGKLPDYQVWELVAYVRSLSGQLPSDIAPSRSDEMPVAKAEQARPKEHPQDEPSAKRGQP